MTAIRRSAGIKRGAYALGVLLLGISLVATGCSRSASTAAKMPSLPAVQGSQSSASAQWPSKMPSDVPKFTYGTITASSNDVYGGNVQATFADVTSDAFEKYQNDLKKAGWTISTANQSASGFEIDATKAPVES